MQQRQVAQADTSYEADPIDNGPSALSQVLGALTGTMEQITANNFEKRRRKEEERDAALRAEESRISAELAASNHSLAESNRLLAEQRRIAEQRAIQQRQLAASQQQQQQLARPQQLAQQHASTRQATANQSSPSRSETSRNTGPYSFTARSSLRLNQGHSVWDVSITNHTNRDLQCQVVVQGSMYAPAAPGRLGSPAGLTNRIVQGDHFSPGATKRYTVVAPTKGSWNVSGCTLNRALDRMPDVPLHRISVDNS